MNHRYKVGYWQEETVNDTTKRRTYVPVSSFIWTMDYKPTPTSSRTRVLPTMPNILQTIT